MNPLTFISRARTAILNLRENRSQNSPSHEVEELKEKTEGLIDKAKKACSDALSINKMFVTSTEGILPSKLMLIIASPHAQNGIEAFHRCYHQLFQKALMLDNDIHGKIILIPPINTGLDDIDNLKVIDMAFKQACLFLKERPQSQVHFVNHRSTDLKQYGSKDFYLSQETFQQIKKSNAIIAERILLKFGQIEQMQGDIIVVPVGKDFSLQSEMIININNSALKSVSQVALGPHQSPELLYQKQLPREIWELIFSFSDLQTIGRGTTVSRIIEDAISQNNFWHTIASKGIIPPLLKPVINYKEQAKINLLHEINLYNWELTTGEQVSLLMMSGVANIAIDKDGELAAKEFRTAINMLRGARRQQSFCLLRKRKMDDGTPLDVLEICLEENSSFRKRLKKFICETIYTVKFLGKEAQGENMSFHNRTMTGEQISSVINGLLFKVSRKLKQITK